MAVVATLRDDRAQGFWLVGGCSSPLLLFFCSWKGLFVSVLTPPAGTKPFHKAKSNFLFSIFFFFFFFFYGVLEQFQGAAHPSLSYLPPFCSHLKLIGYGFNEKLKSNARKAARFVIKIGSRFLNICSLIYNWRRSFDSFLSGFTLSQFMLL